MITQEQKKEYYEKKHSYGFNPSRRKLWLIEKLSKILTTRNKVLDIGCGDGFITACLGLYCPIMGVDITTKNIQKCNIKFYNFNIETDNINNLPPCDTILLLDVIEHINPENELIVLDKIFGHSTDQVIISLPLNNIHGTQIVDRNVNCDDLMEYITGKHDYRLINSEEYSDSPKEEYILLQFKRIK